MLRRLTSRRPGLSRQELADIMRGVDENLARLPIRQPAHSLPDGADEELPPLPDLEDLEQRVRKLRQMRAPLFVVQGWRPPDLVRRLLNLPIAALSYKQRRFNEELLDALDMTLDALRDLRLYAERQELEIRSLKAARHSRGAPEGLDPSDT